MKFLLFGTGEYYTRYKVWFKKEDVVSLIDNSKEKQGQHIDDILVIPPEDILEYEFDAIIILSFYVKAMRTQLLSLGVKEDKIYHFFDLHNLIYSLDMKRKIDCYRFGDRQEQKGAHEPEAHRGQRDNGELKVLLLSHDLTLGGPAIALYHAAQVLIKRGYQVVYASMLDGPLRKILISEGIPVIIDENLMIQTMEETQWIRGYSFVICNTMNFHLFLSARDTHISVAWWLHDALFFYDGVRQEVMDKLETNNMKIWSVGPIPERAVKTFRPDFHVEDLLYGVSNEAYMSNSRKTDREKRKIHFTVIGYIEHRKGQDILLEAVQNLSPEVRQNTAIFFVGQNTSLLAQKIMKTSENIPEIIITGTVDREEINRILEQTDVLVCPSREDPMPTVVAEAMMHGVPCLISDTTGTVQYIRDGIDGIVFQSGNAEQLREMLRKCIQGSYNLEEMGRNARKVFEKYFSMEAFEQRLMSLVEDIDFKIEV